jgi:hypothetical protein
MRTILGNVNRGTAPVAIFAGPAVRMRQPGFGAASDNLVAKDPAAAWYEDPSKLVQVIGAAGQAIGNIFHPATPAPGQTMMPPNSQYQPGFYPVQTPASPGLPSWAIPAGIGALALVGAVIAFGGKKR